MALLSASRERWGERLAAMLLVGLSLELFMGTGYHRVGLVVQHLALWPVILILVAGLAWRDRRRLWAQLRAAPLLVALVGWSVISVGWSIDPVTSAVQAVGLVGTVLGAVWMVTRFERVELAWIVAVPLAVAALASVAAIIVVPGHTVIPDMNPHDPAPRGVFNHRNRMGAAMALGTPLMAGLAWHRLRTASGSLAWHRDTGLWFAAAGATLCAALLIVSSSATAQIALLAGGVAAGAAQGLPRLARQPRVWLVAACITVAAGILMLLALAPTLLEAIFDREMTLTGRVPLWEVLLSEHIANRPWLGHGLMAFWPNHEVMAWDPPHGHNSFVDIALGLGIVASVALAALLAWPLLHALRQQWYLATTERPLPPPPLMGTWTVVLIVLGVATLARDPLWRAQQLQLVVLVLGAAAIEPPRRLLQRDG